MHRIFRIAYEALISAQEQRTRTRLAQELDERTLRDIGLEHEANRARARSRQTYLRFGMY
jgi:uncharacterized protein YjiS (DUF1127 family)